MADKIALFNHKGGVSKTTTTFNLGWMLALQGKTVILVDTDPQCNLTGMVVGFSNQQNLEDIYNHKQNLKDALAPAFKSQPKLIEAVDCLPVEGCNNLYLLPGHVGFAEYEVTLGIAQELSGSIQTLQNLPGSISYLLEQTAAKFKADYILLDMSPSLGAINQNLFTISDFFILPTSPDFFSVMAIHSMASVLPTWYAWGKKANELKILQEAAYPFPKINPQFLGTIIQNYRIRSGEPAAAFQQWIDKIQEAVSDKLVPSLQECNMMLPPQIYRQQGIELDYCLSKISDFNSLIAKSQEYQKPVFALTPEEIGFVGEVLERTIKSQQAFKDCFEKLAERVVGLTSSRHAVSHRSV